MTPLTPLRKRIIAMEVSTVIVALMGYFDRSDQFALLFYHNGIACLALGLLATTAFAMPSWGLAGILKNKLRWREGSRLVIVPAFWLLLFLALYQSQQRGHSGTVSLDDILRTGFHFSLISFAYGIPALIVDALYPDRPAASEDAAPWK